jgi:hypothetical protein
LLEYATSDSRSQPLEEQSPPPEAERQQAEKEPEPPKAAAIDVVKQPAKVVGTAELDGTIWPEVLAALKQKHNTLYGVLRMAEPEFGNDGALKLTFAFAFHQKRSNEAGNRQRLADIIHELTGKTVTIICVLDANAKPADVSPTIKKVDNSSLSTISNIFGEAELLES